MGTRLQILVVGLIAMTVSHEGSAQDFCADLSEAIQHAKRGFTAIKGPETDEPGWFVSRFQFPSSEYDCEIVEHEDSPRQLRLSCTSRVVSPSCERTSSSAYAGLRRNVLACLDGTPGMRIGTPLPLGQGSRLITAGETLRVTGLGRTADGFDVAVAVSWNKTQLRTRTSCRAGVDVELR